MYGSKKLLSNGSDHKEHKAGSVFVDCLTTQEVNIKNLVHFFPIAIGFSSWASKLKNVRIYYSWAFLVPRTSWRPEYEDQEALWTQDLKS